MTKELQQKYRARIRLIDLEVRAARTMVNVPDLWNSRVFRNHLEEITKTSVELTALLDPQLVLEEMH